MTGDQVNTRWNANFCDDDWTFDSYSSRSPCRVCMGRRNYLSIDCASCASPLDGSGETPVSCHLFVPRNTQNKPEAESILIHHTSTRYTTSTLKNQPLALNDLLFVVIVVCCLIPKITRLGHTGLLHQRALMFMRYYDSCRGQQLRNILGSPLILLSLQ
jgi:hypothetical protein